MIGHQHVAQKLESQLRREAAMLAIKSEYSRVRRGGSTRRRFTVTKKIRSESRSRCTRDTAQCYALFKSPRHTNRAVATR